MFRTFERVQAGVSGTVWMRAAMRRGVQAVAVAVFLLGSADVAGACPDHQYEQCTIFGCVCLPKIDVPDIVREPGIQTGGHALAQWLTESRNSALHGAQPIPPQIRQALTGYVDEDLMNRVRFTVGDAGAFNLANLSITYGDANAVTLIDVVVFRSGDDAYNDPALWAHELEHVKQFRDWGSTNFAISYVRNPHGIENPAYDRQNAYAAWRDRQRPTQSGSMRTVVCVTHAGTSAPFYGQPSMPCFMQTPWGRVFGMAR